MIKSTKPFRRLSDLILANIYLYFINIYVATSRKVASWTHSEFYIDKLQNPLLYRAYFINRSRPVELREKEFERREKAIKHRSDQKALDASREHTHNLYAKQEKHRLDAEKWQYDFEEDERAKAAEEARQAAILAAEQEKERLRLYAEQRQKEIEYERATQLDELKRREELYHASATQRKDFPSPVRAVGVHSVTVRNLPSTQCRSISQMTTGAVVTIDGWIRSEVHFGNGVWFRMVKSREFPSGGWVWSGAFTNQSIEALQDLNETPDTYTIKSFDGTVNQTVITQTTMEANIEAEIRSLNQSTKQIVDGTISSGYINATMITADRIRIDSNALTVERARQSVNDINNKAVETLLQISAPKQTVWSSPATLTTEEVAKHTKAKLDWEEKARASHKKIKRLKEENDRQQSINMMNNTINSAIASMNYSSSHSSD